MLEPSSNTDDQAQIAQLQALLIERNAEIKARAAEIETMDRRIRLLEEALRLMRAEKYGASREKLSEAPGQRGLFNEAEAAVDIIEAVGMEPELSVTPLREAKAATNSPGRKALPAHLPRTEVRHELPAIERICGCGSALTEIGAETSEQLDYIPAKIQVIRHVRPKYACSHCRTGVKIAPVPAQLLPRSNASPRLMAHLITSKFVDGQPFHRQETVFARHDVALSRGTQAGLAINALTPVIPLMNLMDERMRASGYISSISGASERYRLLIWRTNVASCMCALSTAQYIGQPIVTRRLSRRSLHIKFNSIHCFLCACRPHNTVSQLLNLLK